MSTNDENTLEFEKFKLCFQAASSLTNSFITLKTAVMSDKEKIMFQDDGLVSDKKIKSEIQNVFQHYLKMLKIDIDEYD